MAPKLKEKTTGASDFCSPYKEQHKNVIRGLWESTKNPLGIHHIDGRRRHPEESYKITICASRHRILDRAKSPPKNELTWRNAIRDSGLGLSRITSCYEVPFTASLKKKIIKYLLHYCQPKLESNDYS